MDEKIVNMSGKNMMHSRVSNLYDWSRDLRHQFLTSPHDDLRVEFTNDLLRE